MTPSSSIARRSSLANIGVLADGFGNDVARAFQGLFHTGNAFFGIDESGGKCFERDTGGLLIPKIVGQRLEAFFAGDRGLGAALGLVGKVEIFQFALVECLLDARLQLVGQLALFLDRGEDGLLAGYELAEIQKLLFDGADLDLIEVAGGLLAIARDEGHGRAFVEELDCSDESLHWDLDRLSNVNQEIGGKRLECGHGGKRTILSVHSKD